MSRIMLPKETEKLMDLAKDKKTLTVETKCVWRISGSALLAKLPIPFTFDPCKFRDPPKLQKLETVDCSMQYWWVGRCICWFVSLNPPSYVQSCLNQRRFSLYLISNQYWDTNQSLWMFSEENVEKLRNYTPTISWRHTIGTCIVIHRPPNR